MFPHITARFQFEYTSVYSYHHVLKVCNYVTFRVCRDFHFTGTSLTMVVAAEVLLLEASVRVGDMKGDGSFRM
jgi:hypothetical protein